MYPQWFAESNVFQSFEFDKDVNTQAFLFGRGGGSKAIDLLNQRIAVGTGLGSLLMSS